MGKKTKIGKQRRDKYYKLAKETGYRSRAAFKLIQLNRKFEFLQHSQVIVDLCAAPGGWLQVASQYIPVSSLLIGVDLVSIRSLSNAITIQDDITTDSCRKAIKRELKTWLADCVLHDGAPNVGKNWIHDAFMQAQLTLSALKLATEILRKGGWFVTKVFRSKDYPALLPVFGKLFKKVHVTKPQASRSESAEIFVVCEYYKKPDKVNPDLLDPKIVFKDPEGEPTAAKINLFKPEKKQKAKAEGYAEGDYTLFHQLKATDFISSSDYANLLASTNEMVIDDELTTPELKECCKDIKVLGRRELRDLLQWRKKMRQFLNSLKTIPEETSGETESNEVVQEVDGVQEIGEQEAFEENRKFEELQDAKRKRKRERKIKKKYRERIENQVKYDTDPAEEIELFSLAKLRKEQQRPKAQEAKESSGESSGDESEEENDEIAEPIYVDLGEDEEEKSGWKEEFFNREIFNSGFDEEELEELDLDIVTGKAKESKTDSVDESEQQSSIVDASSGVGKSSDVGKGEENVDLSRFEDDDDTSDDDDENGNDFEIVKEDEPPSKIGKLSAEGLALGEIMIHSSKTRRNLHDWAYNRRAFNDDSLPDWFVADERKHLRPVLPVSKDQIDFYRQREKALNARPIKRVVEAKARKKKRAVRRLEKAKKRAEEVTGNEDMSEKEKSEELRKIYKIAAGKRKKEPITYVVSKKGLVGKRARRPPGVKGRFRIVDPRMKKDLRRQKAQNKQKKGRGARGRKV